MGITIKSIVLALITLVAVVGVFWFGYFRNDAEKIVWIIVIALATWVGALVYFFVVKQFNPRGLMKR